MDNTKNELISSTTNLKNNQPNSNEIINILINNHPINTISNRNHKPYSRKYNRYSNNINYSIFKNNKHYSTRVIDEDRNKNLKRSNDNNSISYYRKTYNRNKFSTINPNLMSDTNNMSNFILLQKNPKKSLTDINILIRERNEKETISKTKSIDNLNTHNINEYNNRCNQNYIILKNQKNKGLTNNKIKLNNFIKENRFKYFLLYRQPSKILKKCFICDSFDPKLYHTNKCAHLFCNKCGKLYFEHQINNCVYTLKCPKYSCFKHLDINILKQILSKYTYEKLIDNMDTNSQTNEHNLVNISQNINSSRERMANKNSLFSNDNSSFKENKTLIYSFTFQKEYVFNFNKNQNNTKKPKNDLLLKKLTNRFHRNSDKDLVNEHVIKIGGSSKFNKAVRKFNELKNIFCCQCNKSALFSIKNKPFIKCLNCGFSICKFCYKKYDCYHFIRNNANACRVFFRTRFIGRNVKYIYWYQLMYIFGGLIILYIGFTKIEAEFISNYKRNKIYSIYFLFFVILLFINFFILIICLPYYPLILLIVEV